MKLSSDFLDHQSNPVDWKSLKPLELMQYLVSEATKDDDKSNEPMDNNLTALLSESIPISWSGSIISNDSRSSHEESGDFSIIPSTAGKKEKLSGRKRDKMTQMTTDGKLTTSPNGECSKKDFSEVMNNWLRQNWTNPYPDDEGLMQIANSCGCHPSVVSNWLINARTRKWRPAIVKAFENKRPASYLHEDSMNIFDGKPLRSI
jgi:hypothetical protein